MLWDFSKETTFLSRVRLILELEETSCFRKGVEGVEDALQRVEKTAEVFPPLTTTTVFTRRGSGSRSGGVTVYTRLRDFSVCRDRLACKGC